jgi:acyl-CoA synthetase (AMP-forming)/AMP-acid ligase II
VLTVDTVFEPADIEKFHRNGLWHSEFVTDWFEARVAQNPGGLLVSDGQTSLTNEEAWQLAQRLATRLADHGLVAGERAIVQMPNWPEFAVIYLALARLGAIIVPVMPIYGERELIHCAETTGAGTFITCQEFRTTDYLALARALQDKCQSITRVLIVRGKPDASTGVLRYEELVDGQHSTADTGDLGPIPEPETGHVIAFTSGTESKARGCFHTWNTYSSAAKFHAQITNFGPDSIELVPSPIAHATGLAVGLLKPMLSGGSAVFMDIWNPDEALRLITEHRCTHITGAPVFLAGLVDSYDAGLHNVDTLRVFVSAGAPLPPALAARALEVFPALRILPGYGQSEGMLVALTALDDSVERITTVGRPAPGSQIRVINTEGKELPIGDVGEICYHGAGDMLGYWGNDPATAAARTPDGWLRSGDAGYLDDDGYLVLTSRIKDIIIRGGSNISPGEIEELLAKLPTLAQAAVVGYPDPIMGERVCAVVVPMDPAQTPTLEVLREFLRDDCKLARHKLPDRLETIDAFPMTPSGKVIRRQLAEMVANGISS